MRTEDAINLGTDYVTTWQSLDVGEPPFHWAEGVKSLTEKQAREALDELVRQKWLDKREMEYTLSVRRQTNTMHDASPSMFQLTCVCFLSFAELQDWIAICDPEESNLCGLCEEIAVQGERCSNLKCSRKIHFHCLREWAAKRKNTKCPYCQTENTFNVLRGGTTGASTTSKRLASQDSSEVGRSKRTRRLTQSAES